MLEGIQKMGLLVLVLIGVSACTSKYATNGEKLYLNSRNGPGLVVPPPLSSFSLSNFYRLPQQSNPNPQVSLAPPTIAKQ